MGKKGGSSGGSQTTTTVQKADPWSGVQPGLANLYSRAGNWMNSSTPNYYPGATIAPVAPETEQSLNAQAMRARTGNPVINQAQGELTSTIGGDYLGNTPASYLYAPSATGEMLNANPYLDRMYDRAANRVGRQFQDIVNPAIASRYGMAGRTGSGAEMQAYGQAQRELGDTLENLATNVYGGNYAQERALQNQAIAGIGQDWQQERTNQLRGMLFAPEMAKQDYTDIQMLGDVGAQRQSLEQQRINDSINRWNFEQNKELEKLQQYNTLLQGGTSFGTTTGAQTQPLYQNKGAGALGGAAVGAGIGNQIYPGGYGALGGGILGLLMGMS